MKTLLAIATALVGASTMAVEFVNTKETFERFTAGDFNPVAAQDANESVSRWETTGDQTGTIVAYGATDALPVPTEFADGGANYLHVDSGSDTLLRHSVQPTSNGDEVIYGSTDLGVYVDCWTQFTAADELDSLGNTDGDKLRVYLYKDSTNNDALSFHVVAGYLKDSEETPTVTDYEVTCDGVTPAEGMWYHLTIKSIADIEGNGRGVPGFIIFINGTPAVNADSKGVEGSAIGALTGAAKAYNEAGQLFPSLVYFGANNAKQLVGIGFRGTGNVDNISFTDKETFEANNSYAVDPVAEYALTVTGTGLDTKGVNSLTDAIDYATVEGAVIKLNADWNTEFAATNKVAITIDLNGKKLGCFNATGDGKVTFVNNSATAATLEALMVDSDGAAEVSSTGIINVVVGGENYDYSAYVCGTLTVNGGRYKKEPQVDGGSVVYPTGKTLVAGTGDDAGYYVLGSEGGSEGTVITDADGSSFTVPTSVMDAAKATYTVPGKGYNYAQAYALGLYDVEHDTVTGDPVVTIEIVGGVVTVKFEAGTIPDAYTVSYEVYGSTTLKGRNEAGWTKIGDPDKAAAYGTAVTDTVGDDDAKFYMVKVAITDKK